MPWASVKPSMVARWAPSAVHHLDAVALADEHRAGIVAGDGGRPVEPADDRLAVAVAIDAGHLAATPFHHEDVLAPSAQIAVGATRPATSTRGSVLPRG